VCGAALYFLAQHSCVLVIACQRPGLSACAGAGLQPGRHGRERRLLHARQAAAGRRCGAPAAAALTCVHVCVRGGWLLLGGARNAHERLRLPSLPGACLLAQTCQEVGEGGSASTLDITRMPALSAHRNMALRQHGRPEPEIDVSTCTHTRRLLLMTVSGQFASRKSRNPIAGRAARAREPGVHGAQPARARHAACILPGLLCHAATAATGRRGGGGPPAAAPAALGPAVAGARAARAAHMVEPCAGTAWHAFKRTHEQSSRPASADR